MRPATDGDADDVSRGIETTRSENTRQLTANIALERLEQGRQKVRTPDPMLILAREGPGAPGVLVIRTAMGSFGLRAWCSSPKAGATRPSRESLAHAAF
jgi:hypothetical protein